LDGEISPEIVIRRLEKKCLYRTEGWWSYEVCPFGEIRQYHSEQYKDEAGKLTSKVTDQYSLGKQIMKTGELAQMMEFLLTEDISKAMFDEIQLEGGEDDETESLEEGTTSTIEEEHQKEEEIGEGIGGGGVSPKPSEGEKENIPTVKSPTPPQDELIIGETIEHTSNDEKHNQEEESEEDEVLEKEEEEIEDWNPFQFTISDYEPGMILHLSDGSPCDVTNNKRRATKIHISCGEKDEILDVFEDSTCHYTIKAHMRDLCLLTQFKPKNRELSMIYCDIMKTKPINEVEEVEIEIEEEQNSNQEKELDQKEDDDRKIAEVEVTNEGEISSSNPIKEDESKEEEEKSENENS